METVVVHVYYRCVQVLKINKRILCCFSFIFSLAGFGDHMEQVSEVSHQFVLLCNCYCNNIVTMEYLSKLGGTNGIGPFPCCTMYLKMRELLTN